MKKRRSNNNRKVNLIIVVVVFNFVMLSCLINQNPNSIIQNEGSGLNQDQDLKISGADQVTKEWLTNRDFNLPLDPWYNTSGGDTSDLNASASGAEVNYDILGDKGSYSTAEAFPNASGEWIVAQNPDIPLLPFDTDTPSNPTYGTDTDGWWATHWWDQKTAYEHYQQASIHWKKNFTLPVNMADYAVTSVTIDAIVNGTVHSSPSQGGGIDVPGDEGSLAQWANYDSAKFYLLITDLANTKEYEIAYNRTRILGLDAAEYNIGSEYFHDLDFTQLTVYDESILVAYFESIFQSAPGNAFTLALGIDFNCEDNEANDEDIWDELRFVFVNVTLTYEKRIDRYSTLTFNQVGGQIPSIINSTNIEIDSGTFSFDYKIDKLWPTVISPNSEIRVLINGTASPVGVKLSSLTTSYQRTSIDVKGLLFYDKNVTAMIQVIILDNFILNETYAVSIDNASLVIQYSKDVDPVATRYDLFLDGQNKTLSGFIEVPYGETVNISVKYMRASDGLFLDNSDVTISGYGPTTLNLTENAILEHYNITIDTTQLSIGENPLTIVADKFLWITQNIIVNIKILPRDADLSIFLNEVNKTDSKSIFLTAGNPLNITIKLVDSITKNFVDNASVKVYKGEEWNKTLAENSTYEQYSVNVSTTTELNPGISFLTLLINRGNYSTIGESLTISVSVRASNYSLELNGTDSTDYPTITKNVNELINVSFFYRDDLTKNHISIADVTLTIVSVEYNMSEKAGWYEYTINTTNLNQGINFVTVFAQHSQYTPQAILITIEIVQKETNLTLFVNNTETTSDPSYTVIIRDFVNITIKYIELDNNSHVAGSSVQLFGGGVDNNFTEYGSFDQYSILINSSKLTATINFLSIYAIKANYEAQSITVKVTVIEKASSAELFLDTINKTSEKYISLLWNEILNITVTYVDVDILHIGGANLSISGSGISKDFTEDIPLTQYEYYLNTTELGVGVHFLTILATKENYETQTISVQIDITRRIAKIDKIFINQTEQKVFETLWDDPINFTIVYRDNSTNNTIFGAALELKDGGTLIGTFSYDSGDDQFWFNVQSEQLGIGLHYLTISAVLENYTSLSEILTISVKQRETDFGIWLNYTVTSSIEIDWNETLNIIVGYNDTATGNFVGGASVQLKDGETVISNLTQGGSDYWWDLETKVLGVGAKYLTVIASRENYTTMIEFIFVTVNNRETYFDISINGNNITDTKYFEVPLGRELNFTVSYYDVKTGYSITGATLILNNITETIGNFNEVNKIYNLTQYTNKNFEIGLNIITIDAQLQNFTLQNINLGITINRINVSIYPENGTSFFKTEPGRNVWLRVILVNNDFGGTLPDALVTYTSNIPDARLSKGTLEEIPTMPGVYEVLLENIDVPPGTYIITISVGGGGAFDNYDIDRIDITIDLKSPENPLFQILMYIAIGAVIAIGAYVIYYQRVGKYPVPVRKVRKTKKMLKKKKFKDLAIPDRKESFKESYDKEFDDRARFLRSKVKKTLAIPSIKGKIAKKPKSAEKPKPAEKPKTAEKPNVKKLPDKPTDK